MRILNADTLPDGRFREDAEFLRRCAWEIGARRAWAAYSCGESYVNLLMVAPSEAFAAWHVEPGWVERTESSRRAAWRGARLILRLYDVSNIIFNGLNAHHIRDYPLPGLAGERLLGISLAGTWQIAEVGFLLQTGEFVPAARSQTAAFARDTASPHYDATALSVDDRLVPGPLALLGEDGVHLVGVTTEDAALDEGGGAFDAGRVKATIGLGAFDRLLLFIGPLESAAGPDLMIEALPVVLARRGETRLVFVGDGGLRPALEQRAQQLGAAHAVRFLGHVAGDRLAGLLRASEALVLPSRCRVANDDGVVDLARRAGRPVVTTQGGPRHRVRHEEDGLVTYDNPGSMVWAMSRVLEDPDHARAMGRRGAFRPPGDGAARDTAAMGGEADDAAAVPMMAEAAPGETAPEPTGYDQESRPRVEPPRPHLVIAGGAQPLTATTLAIFCHHLDGDFGAHVVRRAAAVARLGKAVELYCADGLGQPAPENLTVHAVGDGASGDLVARALDFCRRACAEFRRTPAAGDGAVTLLAQEWSAVPALRELGTQPAVSRILALGSCERQRSDMRSEVSRRIDALEREGLEEADHVLVEDGAVAALARQIAPACAPRIVHGPPVFPVEEFASRPDPAVVKARFQVGPVDPVVLFVGDLDERHAPDLLLRAMPALLKNHPQLRLVIVGDGGLMWTLRVQARYLLLDHAVRITGHIGGQDVRDLIAAADVIAVPSRVATEDWQLLAGWAAARPVVATHEAAGELGEHEGDCVMIYPNAGSCVWGIERVLYDPELARRIAGRGHEKLDQLRGWGRAAAQLEGLMARAPAGRP